MHRRVTSLRLRARPRDDRGAIALLVAAMMTSLVVIAAMVLDFGLVRVDRQIDRSAADAATLAGLHGLMSRGDGTEHPFVGVCSAVRYLKVNNARFAGINEANGWKNGLGMTTADGCSDQALRNTTCSRTNHATWAKWSWSGSYNGVALNVTVQSGFSFAGSTRPEDSLVASSGDTTDAGCDTLAITIDQSRSPGLGSIVSNDALSTSIQSVGRVKPGPGRVAPAMLLLKRTGCPALRTGNNGGGAGNTFIHVFGATTSTGYTAPGTIHADSDGDGCTGGSNSNVFIGAQNDGIVTYAAPLASNPSAPDPLKPGMITSVAKQNEKPAGVVRDSLDNAYGSSALLTGGTKNEVSGRSLITRKLIDDRYITTVRSAISTANTVMSGAGTPAGFTAINSCSPTQASINSLTAADKVYVNCTANNGFNGQMSGLVIKAGTVYFKGWINPSGLLQMPNATKVYVENSGDKTNAIGIGNTASFEMNNASANLTGSGFCNTAVSTSMSKATLFLKRGGIAQSGSGMLRLCRTTAFLMGGQDNGCVPTTSGTAPTSTPCGSGLGTGQFSLQGGLIDWTAPNTLDQTIDTVTKLPVAGATAAWQDVNGPEDLALWSESAANGTSTTFNMNGGGGLYVRGVYMVPNADLFKISGNALMDLTNAQFIVTSIELNGGTKITMKVDPNAAVTLPELDTVGLIR